MKKQTQHGFTSIELAVALLILAVLGLVVSSIVMNTASATEERATQSMQHWLDKNELNTVRKSCAPDSDHDGYGSCAVVLADTGEKVFLQCTAGWFSHLQGVLTCKEADMAMQVTTRRSR